MKVYRSHGPIFSLTTYSNFILTIDLWKLAPKLILFRHPTFPITKKKKNRSSYHPPRCQSRRQQHHGAKMSHILFFLIVPTPHLPQTVVGPPHVDREDGGTTCSPSSPMATFRFWFPRAPPPPPTFRVSSSKKDVKEMEMNTCSASAQFSPPHHFLGGGVRIKKSVRKKFNPTTPGRARFNGNAFTKSL